MLHFLLHLGHALSFPLHSLVAVLSLLNMFLLHYLLSASAKLLPIVFALLLQLHLGHTLSFPFLSLAAVLSFFNMFLFNHLLSASMKLLLISFMLLCS
jgi:hypothetical protein